MLPCDKVTADTCVCVRMQVGNTPGVTKVLQEVHLDKQIRLLDSPGVVFASSESEAAAALRNCVKVCVRRAVHWPALLGALL